MKNKRLMVILVLFIGILPIALYGAHQIQKRADNTHIIAPRVLVLTPEYYTFGGDTSVENLILAAGGQNAATERPAYSQLSDAELIVLNPDVIIFTDDWHSDDIARLQQIAAYQAISAIKNARVYHLQIMLTDLYIATHHATLVMQFQTWFQAV